MTVVNDHLVGTDVSEFRNFGFENLAADPTGAKARAGHVYFNTATSILRGHNGTAYIDIPAAAVAALTDAQIKTQYENNADTNALTDAKLADLNNTTGTNSGDQNAAGVPTAGIAGIAGGATSDVQTVLEAINAKADTLASVTGNFIPGASTFAALPTVDVDGTTAVEDGDITLLDTVDGGNLKGLYIRSGGAWILLVEVPAAITITGATTTVAGTVELADNAETVTGTDATRAVTPAGLTAALDATTFTAQFGDGTVGPFVLAHGLGTADLVVNIRDASGAVLVGYTVDATNITISPLAVVAANAYTVVASK